MIHIHSDTPYHSSLSFIIFEKYPSNKNNSIKNSKLKETNYINIIKLIPSTNFHIQLSAPLWLTASPSHKSLRYFTQQCFDVDPRHLAHHGIQYPLRRRTKRLQASPSVSSHFQSQGSRQIVPELMMHFAWDWLTLSDLSALSSVSQPLLNYAKLRHDTFQLSVVTLSTMLRPLDPHNPAVAISTLRTSHLASILLLCDFNTGAFIRLLGHCWGISDNS